MYWILLKPMLHSSDSYNTLPLTNADTIHEGSDQFSFTFYIYAPFEDKNVIRNILETLFRKLTKSSFHSFP